MNAADSSFRLLQCWQTAYRTVGEAALLPFGLSEANIDAMLTVDETVWRRWAELPLTLAQPRRGLLGALGAGNEHRVLRFVAKGRGKLTTPEIQLLAVPVNTYLLAIGRRAATNMHWSRLFDLDNDEIAALGSTEDADLEQWGTLPVAVATPRPGLLPGLLEREEPQLVASLNELQR